MQPKHKQNVSYQLYANEVNTRCCTTISNQQICYYADANISLCSAIFLIYERQNRYILFKDWTRGLNETCMCWIVKSFTRVDEIPNWEGQLVLQGRASACFLPTMHKSIIFPGPFRLKLYTSSETVIATWILTKRKAGELWLVPGGITYDAMDQVNPHGPRSRGWCCHFYVGTVSLMV